MMLALLPPLATGWPKFKKDPPPVVPEPTSLFASPALAAAGATLLIGILAGAAMRRKPVGGGTVLKPKHYGVKIGSIMLFVSVSAAAVTFPFMQTRRDALGCDALCQGGQTSMRSGLMLIGAALIGRASDRVGRIPMLWIGLAASLLSLALNIVYDSLEGMWYAIIPVALFNQNFSVAKALFSDYIDELGGTDADRAGAVGRLGMAVGFSFMAGPLIATLLVKDYLSALYVSLALTAASSVFIVLLPQPRPTIPTVPKQAPPSGVMAFLTMPVLQTRGAQLLMLMRLLMALAFHMFSPVWQVSIKTRFDFAPTDHAQFMGLVGLTYALSQGVIAKPLIRLSGADPTKLILLCILFLGGARPFALWTSSVAVVYALYVPMVISLGVMNTAITTACSSLAAGDQLGGLFGVMESVESVAGMVGPPLGGLLAKTHEHATLAAVCSCYGLTFTLVSLFFGAHVSRTSVAKKDV